jgi:phosphatidate cytidylyltransferase
MHLKRWITGLVTLPLIILLISKGGSFLFAIFISFACIIALWEYFRIVFHTRGSANQSLITILGFFTAPFIIWASYINSFKILLSILTFNLIISALISIPKFKFDSYVSEIVTKQVMGIIYIPLFISYLVLIRNGVNGISWTCFLLFIVFSGDIGAFYIGSYFGRHKLCPAISPNKTIEGAAGGLVANLLVGSLFKYFFMPLLPWGLSLLLFLVIGVSGQVGDLFESELKRGGNVKDSGVLLPGHGGVLDRIDALLFAAPVAYLFKEFILL